MSPDEKRKELQDWIQKNMISDEFEILSSYKERIARIVGITSSGNIVFRVNLSTFDNKLRIAFYLIGKLMAYFVEKVEKPAASNKEIESILGIPKGTVGRSLKELREQYIVRQMERGLHEIIVNKIPEIIECTEKQV